MSSMIRFTRALSKIGADGVMNYGKPPIKAVIFDLAGVLMPSPGKFFTEFETRLQAPKGSLIKTILASGDDGAWYKLERGEIDIYSFGERFGKECLRELKQEVNARDLLHQMLKYFSCGEPFPIMIDVIKCLKSCGIKTALLTNNFFLPNNETYVPLDHQLFDVVIESAKVGMRKPEQCIYERVINDLDVMPFEAVFLDDLGHNLITAQDMGIKTIKVKNSGQAIRELEAMVLLKLKSE